MATIQNLHTGDGSTTNFSFTFTYLDRTDIKCQLDAEVTENFSFANATTIAFDTAPGNNVKIKIYRETDTDTAPATFYAGSSIKSEDLNDNFTQQLYAVQEINGRYLSALGGTMVGDLTLGEDVDLVFEGATDDGYETTLTVADPTADRTITLPNVTGTVVTTGDTGTVTSTMITDATIVDGDIANTTITGGKLVNDTITATQIAANAVTSSELAGDAVTGTHIADDAVNSEHFVDGSIDRVHLAADIVDGTKIADDSIDSEHIVDGSVDLAHLAADSVNSSKIVDGSIVASDIANATITGAKLVNDTITSTQIGANAVTASELADDAVDTAAIVNDAVDGTKIADNAIDSEHYTDGSIDRVHLEADIIDSTKLADNAVGTEHIADAELTTLAGMQSGTASVLAGGTALTATLSELNLLDGKSIVTSISSPTDVQIPTAQAVEERIVDLVTDVGGFRPIANETSFPTTNPDPEDNAGTIVSIKALASNLTSNGSGVATIANGAGSGNTVTINGMANSDTIEAGKGILVETTSTLHTYTFHRETLAPADITSAASAVSDFNERYRVNAGEPSSSLHEGDLVYDTNADKMKVYDTTTSAWKEVTSTGDFKYLFLCPAGGTGAPTINGSIATYDLREGSNSGSAASVTNAAQLIVSVNGVVQKANTGTSAPAEGFAIVDANTIIFSSNLPSGASVFIHQAGSAVSIPTPGDDTVSTVKIQNLAVTTGKIADQAVALTKLPHGDGSSNGKFLRSNNGADPTWETVSTTPEGTAILSTGESGASKFLREDGDGTSSWQTVVGAVADNCIYENDQTISNNYTIASGKGAHSVGPITVNATVTVNGNWVVS